MPSNEIVLQNANLLTVHRTSLANRSHVLISAANGEFDIKPLYGSQGNFALLEESSKLLLQHLQQFNEVFDYHHTALAAIRCTTLHEIYNRFILQQGLLGLAKIHIFDLVALTEELNLEARATELIESNLQSIQDLRHIQRNCINAHTTELVGVFTSEGIASFSRITEKIRYFAIGNRPSPTGNYDIQLGLVTAPAKWERLYQNPITAEISIQILVNGVKCPVTASIYPDYRGHSHYIPQTLEEYNSHAITASTYFENNSDKYKVWNSTFQAKTLCAMLAIPPSTTISTETLLIYLQTLVEIAYLQPYSQIVVYSSLAFSASFGALGFLIHKPNGISPIEDDPLLLHPFSFSMHNVSTQEVAITENGIKTTYAELMSHPSTRLIDHQKHKAGVIPDFYQPKRLTPGFSYIYSREISARPLLPTLQTATTTIDYLWVENPERLKEVGCGSQPAITSPDQIRRVFDATPSFNRRPRRFLS